MHTRVREIRENWEWTTTWAIPRQYRDDITAAIDRMCGALSSTCDYVEALGEITSQDIHECIVRAGLERFKLPAGEIIPTE